jgi:hypothetical protein
VISIDYHMLPMSPRHVIRALNGLLVTSHDNAPRAIASLLVSIRLHNFSHEVGPSLESSRVLVRCCLSFFLSKLASLN